MTSSLRFRWLSIMSFLFSSAEAFFSTFFAAFEYFRAPTAEIAPLRFSRYAYFSF